MCSFSPIATKVSDIYGVSDLMVSLLVNMFFVSFIILNFPAMVVLEKGTKAMMKYFRIFAALSMIGAWIKYIALS